MASVLERITNALSSLGKRRERDNGSQDNARGGAAAGSERERKRVFRPWEQADLHRRLESYKPLTWFAKPESVGPVPCALRGWVNNACDSLTCEHCGAKLVYPPRVAYDQRQAAADKFAPFLTSKHESTCPWRQTQCETNLLAYQPSSTNDELCNLFQALQDKLLRVDVLPDLDAIAIQTVRDAARPYGSYEDIVLGSGGAAGAITPRVRITTLGDEDGGGGGVGADGARRSPASASAAGGGVSGGVADPAACETIIIQPSKLTPQQKARLLALLGWDVEVLQPDTATGSAAAPYAQSTGYSLAHLGVKPKKAPIAGASAPGGSTAAKAGAAGKPSSGGGCGGEERYPMAQVVLKCPRCHNRMGLWNFAGVRPVPSGRLTPGQPAAGAGALLSPRVGSTGGAVGAAIAPAPAGDPLSATIAGGQYALHGLGAGGPKPFGAASATPFRFGSGSGSAPVFGMAALEVDPSQRSTAGGAAGSFGFGSPLGSPAPKLLIGSTTLATPPPPSAAGAAAARGSAPLTGHKRKALEPGLVPEPMEVDAAGRQTPAVSAGGAPEGKRQRLGSEMWATPTAPGSVPGPHGMRSPVPEVQQLRELDPVNQHRSWCPWVYTGAAGTRQMSGWQHMLTALNTQQQAQLKEQLQSQPEASPSPTAAMASDSLPAGAASPAVDARQVRDNALAAIRSL